MRPAPLVLLASALACGGSEPAPAADPAELPPPEAEPPVALNADLPIAYPPALFDQRTEGDVVLRLFVDSTGALVPDSTRVADPSGYPALDSAALAGSARLRFAPAKRRGVAVATAFLQPVEFRHPGGGAAPSAPARPPAARPPARRPAATPTPPAPPRAPAVQVPRDTAAALPDTTRPRPDTTRPRPDTARPPADTSRPPTHISAAAH